MPETTPPEPQQSEQPGGEQLPSAEELAQRGRELKARIDAHWSQLGQLGHLGQSGQERGAGR